MNCLKITLDNINEEMYEMVCDNNYIFQEPIIQHDDLNKIYQYSVNPIRIFTFIDDNKKVNILPSFITFGRDNNVISNASHNSIFVNIDVITGALNDYGYSYLQYGGHRFYEHPDTKIVFKNIKIPYFEECKNMVVEAASYIPYKLIGWDVAVTPDGPLIIEGNGRGSMGSIDIAYGGLKKHPVIKEILKKYT